MTGDECFFLVLFAFVLFFAGVVSLYAVVNYLIIPCFL